MNYNTLINKPTINYRELIGDSAVSEVGGITEEEFNTLLGTDLASYYTKAQIDDLFARSYVYREKSGSIVTFDCPSTSQSIPELTAEIVAVQAGNGDPSPTNVRPISGWSAVNRYRTGKNLFDESILLECSGWAVSDGVYSGESAQVNTKYGTGVPNLKFKPNTQYTFSFTYGQDGSTGIGLAIVIRYTDNTLTQKYCNIDSVGFVSVTSTVGKSIKRLELSYGANRTIQLSNMQLEENTTPTTYEAYSGQTYTTQLKDGNNQPLTCYGGELADVNGVQTLTLTHGYIASYNGETLPSTWISDRDVYAEGTIPTTGAEVVYTLATPQTIPQDSLSIATQDGVNNIWADSGDITVKALDKIIQG